ncbi:MAG: ethanolamine utilization protein EutJ [Propionibacteriaceae bacterium]|jgi:ethanolamine utilization protein EutJ|nr:ethanolamine utilization protein EutJ [Propionibacteriaceae bacterium]
MSYEDKITSFAAQVREGKVAEPTGELRLGVDLGTANIVLSVIDAEDQPVAGAWEHSTVVRDGIVVDWAGAVKAVCGLKEILENRLRCRFTAAAVDIPPGISEGTIKVFRNVLTAADLAVSQIVDEPVAASRVLGIADGCVIDIGHGTTGVSILKGGEVVQSVDEPTGGHHMNLVLAGAYQVSYDEAEDLKKDPKRTDDVFGVIRPTLEKMATIAQRAIAGHRLEMVHLVGGAASLPDAPDVFSAVLGLPVVRPLEPLFVTPLGVAMGGKK